MEDMKNVNNNSIDDIDNVELDLFSHEYSNIDIHLCLGSWWY